MLAILQADINAAREGLGTPVDHAILRRGWTRVGLSYIRIQKGIGLLLSDEALAAEDAVITQPCELLLLPVPERRYRVVTEPTPYGGSIVSHVYED